MKDQDQNAWYRYVFIRFLSVYCSWWWLIEDQNKCEPFEMVILEYFSQNERSRSEKCKPSVLSNNARSLKLKQILYLALL